MSILKAHYGVLAASVFLPALGLGLGFLLEGPGAVQVTPLLVFLPCLGLGAVLSVPACVLGVVAVRRGRRAAYPGTVLAAALVLFWVWFLFLFPRSLARQGRVMTPGTITANASYDHQRSVGRGQPVTSHDDGQE
ncbi:MAG: hypothetical protein ACYSU0_05310 [Planctomycetota bacterium]